MTSKQSLIDHLGLVLHPNEGGYFRRTYQSDLEIEQEGRRRYLLTSIFYLLTDDQPLAYLHKNKSDIIHYYHLGAPIKYLLVSAQGRLSEHILGPDIENGQQLQLLVKGGYWKAARLSTGEYGLISEAVAPGFEYQDNELATLSLLREQFAECLQLQTLAQYIKPA